MRIVDELEVEVVLAGVDTDAQKRNGNCKGGAQEKPELGRNPPRAKNGLKGRIIYRRGGDGDAAGAPAHPPHAALLFVYLPPLHDAADQLPPGHNRLVPLIGALAPAGDADRDAIEDVARKANEALDKIAAIQRGRDHIATRLGGMTGGGRFAQKRRPPLPQPPFQGRLRPPPAKNRPFPPPKNGEKRPRLKKFPFLVVLPRDRRPHEPTQPSLPFSLRSEKETHIPPPNHDLLISFIASQLGLDSSVSAGARAGRGAEMSAWAGRIAVSSRRSPRSGGPLKVMGRCSVRTVDVRADGTVCAPCGTALLALVAQRLGFSDVFRGRLRARASGARAMTPGGCSATWR